MIQQNETRKIQNVAFGAFDSNAATLSRFMNEFPETEDLSLSPSPSLEPSVLFMSLPGSEEVDAPGPEPVQVRSP